MPPENGLFNATAGLLGNNTLFATATYTCDLGFNLSGSANLVCTNTSEWLPAAPNCTISRINLRSETYNVIVQLLFIDSAGLES